MSYQVLARKWRPQTFAEVVGQEHLVTALVNGLSLGRIHHAYLFSGTRGVGKTTIARLLAKSLNCKTGITATPCGQCQHCQEIKQGRFLDLIEIDAASRTKVEDIRDLLDNVQYAPAGGRFKVYLIDEVHMLSSHSFNALLKTIEEPPAHIKFLLATTEPQKLPATILSRCLQFHLKALDIEQIRNQLYSILQHEHIVAEPRALHLLARVADGSMRDALSLTDQAIAMGDGEVNFEVVRVMLGKLNTEQPLALIEALANADGGAMMAQLAQCATSGIGWERLLVTMLSLLHRLALGQLVPEQLNDEEDPASRKRLRDLVRLLPPADLQLYYQTLLIGRKELPFAPDPRMGVEMTLLRALAFHPAAVETGLTAATAVIPGDDQDRSAPTSASHTRPVALNNASCAGTNPSPPAATTPPGPAPVADDSGSVGASPLGLGEPTLSSAGGCQPRMVDHAEEERLIPAYAGREFADDEAQIDSTLTPEKIAPWPPMTPSAAGDSSSYPHQLPDTTAQLLQARISLLKRQESKKKIPRPRSRQNIDVNTLARLANVVGAHAPPHQPAAGGDAPMKTPWPEASRGRANHTSDEAITEPLTTPKALAHENTPELALAAASRTRDLWEVKVPQLVEQLALNACKANLAPGKVWWHIRADLGMPVALTVTEDDQAVMKTPLAWRQAIYEANLIRAREAIINDTHIQMLQRDFDAALDEDSIQPG